MYTDGVNEAMNAADEEFSMVKVRELTKQGGDAETVNKRIVNAVLEHVGDAPPFDDMCSVIVERTDEPQNDTVAINDTVDEDAINSAL